VAIRPLVAALTALAAVGCAVSPPGGATRPLTAVATTSAWGSILSQLGGDRVRTYTLIKNPNADPHDYEPTPADARALSLASLVVENGVGYDAWAHRVLDASPDDRRIVINVGDLAHVGDNGNPHLWYSPADVEMLINAADKALAKLDPADASYFAERRESLEQQGLARYRALITDIRTRYADAPIGASESLVAPLAGALRLKLETPPSFLRAISEGIEPSAVDKKTIDAQLRDHRIAVYIYNRQNSTPDISDQVAAAQRARIPVVAMTETLTPEGASFQDWQVAQLTALRTALQRATGR
jgi:zinc/manganese transport system substrate-binding protein